MPSSGPVKLRRNETRWVATAVTYRESTVKSLSATDGWLLASSADRQRRSRNVAEVASRQRGRRAVWFFSRIVERWRWRKWEERVQYISTLCDLTRYNCAAREDGSVELCWRWNDMVDVSDITCRTIWWLTDCLFLRSDCHFVALSEVSQSHVFRDKI